jgi:hypothetical protein
MKRTLAVAAVLAMFLAGCADSEPQTNRERFCDRHDCIGDWENADGYRVHCLDGAYSFSGGESGACSSHGGVGRSRYYGSGSAGNGYGSNGSRYGD